LKKTIFAILIFMFAVSVMGCNQTVDEDSSKNDEPGIIGYVMNKENDRILVINPEAHDFVKLVGFRNTMMLYGFQMLLKILI